MSLFLKLTHSPAPWVDNGNEPDYWPITDADGFLVANVWRHTEHGKSNARLIAAALELLRENQSAVASLGTIIRQLEVADTAICESDDIDVDLMQLADELRLIRNCLENVARKAQGVDNQCN